MSEQTEAACLLQSGAMYGSRALLRRPAAEPVFAGFKHAAFSLYFGDAPIFHFDLEGRWQRAFVEGRHYLKGLDTTVQAIDRAREGANLVLKRRTLGPAESSRLDARARAAALGLLDGRLEPTDPPPSAKARPLSAADLRAFLERIAAWDESAWSAHRARYEAAYPDPLPFLPPDAQNAVVLQATAGPAGGAPFGLGPVPPRPAGILGPEEFADHARAVAALLGRRAEASRALFLAGSDFLRQSAEWIASTLETAGQVFALAADQGQGPRPGGIDTFLDDLNGLDPGPAAWSRFRSLRLRRVSLGVESGEESVRALYAKTWKNEALRAVVADMKGAGLGVNVLVLADAGGAEHAGRHRAATADLIATLGLGAGDLVALLDGEEVRDPARAPTGFTPLTAAARAESQTWLRAAIRSGGGPKVAPYSLEKQGG